MTFSEAAVMTGEFQAGLERISQALLALSKSGQAACAALEAWNQAWRDWLERELAQMTPNQRREFLMLIEHGWYQLDALIAVRKHSSLQATARG